MKDDNSTTASQDGQHVEGEDDHSSSVADSSTTMHSRKTGENNTESESSTLARRETTAVNRSKMLVLLALFLAATAVGVATYIFARNSEQNTFQQKVSKNDGYRHDHVVDVMFLCPSP